MVCPPVRELIKSLKLVDYPLAQADKPWRLHSSNIHVNWSHFVFIIPKSTIFRVLSMYKDIVSQLAINLLLSLNFHSV